MPSVPFLGLLKVVPLLLSDSGTADFYLNLAIFGTIGTVLTWVLLQAAGAIIQEYAKDIFFGIVKKESAGLKQKVLMTGDALVGKTAELNYASEIIGRQTAEIDSLISQNARLQRELRKLRKDMDDEND